MSVSCILGGRLIMLRLHKNRGAPGNGFVLFEVMLSLAILCLGLILILNSFKVGLKAVKASNDYTQATLLLAQRIGELENVKYTLSAGKIEGVFEDAPKFTWAAEIKELQGIKEVKIIVEWKDGIVDLVTYL